MSKRQSKSRTSRRVSSPIPPSEGSETPPPMSLAELAKKKSFTYDELYSAITPPPPTTVYIFGELGPHASVLLPSHMQWQCEEPFSEHHRDVARYLVEAGENGADTIRYFLKRERLDTDAIIYMGPLGVHRDTLAELESMGLIRLSDGGIDADMGGEYINVAVTWTCRREVETGFKRKNLNPNPGRVEQLLDSLRRRSEGRQGGVPLARERFPAKVLGDGSAAYAIAGEMGQLDLMVQSLVRRAIQTHNTNVREIAEADAAGQPVDKYTVDNARHRVVLIKGKEVKNDYRAAYISAARIRRLQSRVLRNLRGHARLAAIYVFCDLTKWVHKGSRLSDFELNVDPERGPRGFGIVNLKLSRRLEDWRRAGNAISDNVFMIFPGGELSDGDRVGRDFIAIPEEPDLLSDPEKQAIQAMREVGHRMKADELSIRAFGKDPDGHSKSVFANLVRREIFDKDPYADPPGYGLVEWKSGPSQD